VAHYRDSYGESLALVMQFVSQVTDFVKYVKVHVLRYITFGTTIATESHIPRPFLDNANEFSSLDGLGQFVPAIRCPKNLVQKEWKSREVGRDFIAPDRKHRL
jgi:hypothetical protein